MMTLPCDAAVSMAFSTSLLSCSRGASSSAAGAKFGLLDQQVLKLTLVVS